MHLRARAWSSVFRRKTFDTLVALDGTALAFYRHTTWKLHSNPQWRRRHQSDSYHFVGGDGNI